MLLLVKCSAWEAEGHGFTPTSCSVPKWKISVRSRVSLWVSCSAVLPLGGRSWSLQAPPFQQKTSHQGWVQLQWGGTEKMLLVGAIDKERMRDTLKWWAQDSSVEWVRLQPAEVSAHSRPCYLQPRGACGRKVVLGQPLWDKNLLWSQPWSYAD